jgi:hypothetical protein
VLEEFIRTPKQQIETLVDMSEGTTQLKVELEIVHLDEYVDAPISIPQTESGVKIF